ncbi:hypothetical protein BX600DRAFT_457282 [Xylariales sp. PMI_506]|nr:hypothetical protein BX600DRAFT_457282 [Xylariales sp. PMI_506]
MWSAINTLTNSLEIYSAILTLGPMNPAFTTQSWYTVNVPPGARSELNDVINALLSVQTSVLNAGTTGTGTVAITTVVTTTTTPTGSTSSSKGRATSPTGSATTTTAGATASTGSAIATTVSHAGARAPMVTPMAIAGLAAAVAAGAAFMY